MTVDLTPLHAPIQATRSGEEETAKGDIISIPDTAKEKPEEDEVLDIQPEGDQVRPLDAKEGHGILLGIQIDDEGYLVIREEEHLATLSGIAKVASGKKY
jgi:co-chaperonin GroES (HSP10)